MGEGKYLDIERELYRICKRLQRRPLLAILIAKKGC